MIVVDGYYHLIWQAHSGLISRICWLHPEFGSLFASCGSSDHDVKIWEEMTPSSWSTSTTANANNESNLTTTPTTPAFNSTAGGGGTGTGTGTI